MVASVLIEYNVKSWIDVLITWFPKSLNIIKIGNKVLVPFGKTKVEGFVLGLSMKLMYSLIQRNCI